MYSLTKASPTCSAAPVLTRGPPLGNKTHHAVRIAQVIGRSSRQYPTLPLLGRQAGYALKGLLHGAVDLLPPGRLSLDLPHKRKEALKRWVGSQQGPGRLDGGRNL
jgi:hypothetical protein